MSIIIICSFIISVGASMLQVQGIEVGFSNNLVLKGVDLHLEPAEIIALLGASGSGKTTILRTVAGFQPVHKGEILLRNHCVARYKLTVPPEKRGLGMVFQDYALFPHLNVADNISFGLWGWSKAAKKARVNELLELVKLSGLEKRFPHELSGGQKQRVALTRALAPKPDMILMDEPFSNLDPALRQSLAREVRDILKQTGTAAIVVTHDINEAIAISDRTGTMNDGLIEQWQAYDKAA
jgi:iron(III) transport system ATP-binding protein